MYEGCLRDAQEMAACHRKADSNMHFILRSLNVLVYAGHLDCRVLHRCKVSQSCKAGR